MINESCIFRFKNPNGIDSFLPDKEIKIVLDAIDLRRLKVKSISLEIDQDLYSEFKSNIDPKTNFIVENIVIDIFNNFNPSVLDIIFNFLYSSLKDSFKKPNSIIIIGYSTDIHNLKSVFNFLCPHCKKEKIGLIGINKWGVSDIIELGRLPTGLQIPKVPALSFQLIDPVTGTDQFNLESIINCLEKHTKFLYGHFHIKFKNIDFHSNGILSIKKCLDTENFIPNFRNYIKSFFDNKKLKILTLCIKESGIDELVKSIANNDIELFNLDEQNKTDSFNLLILTDFLSGSYKIDGIIRNLKRKCSIKTIKIIGISKFKDFVPVNQEWLIESDFSEYNLSNQKCSYCSHGSIALDGTSFNEFRKSISEFDTYSFWELIKISSSHFSIEHYPSKRTLNHFDFRIICEGIFKKYSYTIANRLINLADKKGIFPLWFHKILFTNDKELLPLISDFLEILDIKNEYKIEINREFIDAISADNPGEKIEELFLKLNNDYLKDKEWKFKNNVLIIDQAAHNFKTLSALGSICKKYNLTLLSIALFINRADPISTNIFVKNFHLLSLYDWPVRPTKFNVCFCKNPES